MYQCKMAEYVALPNQAETIHADLAVLLNLICRRRDGSNEICGSLPDHLGKIESNYVGNTSIAY
jgi:hypothetical protein